MGKNNNNLPWQKLNLWSHQKNAISACLNYYNKKKYEKSFLVMIPTGAGKTAISAVLSRMIPIIKNTLIIVPSEALREQNRRKIERDQWIPLNIDVKSLKEKKIIELFPSNVRSELNGVEDGQFVGVLTAQALLAIYNKRKNEYNELKSIIDLVIFDEGHREPALEWSNAIRDLSKPTILLSATPYRNDFKIFNIDIQKFYQFSYDKTHQTKIIRKIVVKEIPNLCSSVDNFTNEIIDFQASKKQEFNKDGIKDPKVIIRCGTQEEISQIVESLRKKGKTVVGIHENFRKSIYFVKNVPIGIQYEYWVHQFKLTEGIDDPAFCIVAVYSHFGNSRALIQQIGRITRNPKQKTNLSGYVLCDSQTHISKEWESYLLFDKYIEKNQKLFSIDEIVEQYINLHPELFYLLNRFRKQLDFDQNNLFKSFRYRLSTTIFNNSNNIGFDEIISSIKNELDNLDYDIKNTENAAEVLKNLNLSNHKSTVITYLKYSNSDILLYDLFIEVKLSFTIIIQINNQIYYYDSDGRYSEYLSKNMTAVEISKLERLLISSLRYNKITLLNTDLGKHSIRSKSLSAFSLEDTAPSLTDHQQIYSNVNIVRNTISLNSKRRYVGFTKGRVTDSASYSIEIEDYMKWVKNVSDSISSIQSYNDNYLDRFASILENPTNTEPINILIDIEDVRNSIFNIARSNAPLEFEEICLTIESKLFNWTINQNQYQVIIDFDDKLKRYDLYSPGLESYILFSEGEKTNENLVSYLNRTQSFRLIIKNTYDVYAFGHFYKPKLDIVGRKATNQLPLLSIFESYASVNRIASEKGNSNLRAKNNIWHKDTLFGLIARRGKGYDKKLEQQLKFDLLICNDLQSEESDFIGCNTKDKKIVLVHAKALKKTKKVSASVFQEACGQLIKNLDYLTPYSEREFDYKKWDKIWKIKDIGNADRIIKGKGNGSKNNKIISDLIKDPKSTKEVWIFIGNGFNLSEFESKLNSGKEPELIQIIYLLTSTWEAASQVGAKLRIFC